MAEKNYPTATEMDYPQHESSYDRFLRLIKMSLWVVVPVTILVIWLVAA
ncbi:MAG: aa3-type cytochrome c oxidase subunit IV [Sphingomonas sp.]|nr:aa3-type cytochrome c oxidase subunit IV [Sphingomonas sp.]RZV53370.1 MAG: aa3-type cytochrome c oxidase subunit IV [Sphingomonadaceae bacterium]